jgi:hypothetical protein
MPASAFPLRVAGGEHQLPPDLGGEILCVGEHATVEAETLGHLRQLRRTAGLRKEQHTELHRSGLKSRTRFSVRRWRCPLEKG